MDLPQRLDCRRMKERAIDALSIEPFACERAERVMTAKRRRQANHVIQVEKKDGGSRRRNGSILGFFV